MRRQAVLVTGASGEIGHGLISHLAERGATRIVALDIRPMDEELVALCHEAIVGNILDNMLLGRLVSEYEIRVVYHLAAILSTQSEFSPEDAHRVNVEGMVNLLRLAVEQARWQGKPVKFMYPGSIAAYGLPSLGTKARAGRVKEDEWCTPTTMYGCNKFYCEHLGRYYSRYYRQLAADYEPGSVDFRCVRFPGLISAVTLPTGGTSDYAPEMIHHAAQRLPYACFVRPDTCMPFMVMPDAIKTLALLEAAPRENLSRDVYNVTAFSASAEEILDMVRRAFPDAQVTFEPHSKRQAIVDSWPADVDDSAARRDWGWEPDYDLNRAFEEYLIPTISRRYQALA